MNEKIVNIKLDAVLSVAQRQGIVFLAIYLALFGPLITGWHVSSGRHALRPPASVASLPQTECSLSAATSADHALTPCEGNPSTSRSGLRLTMTPGTFVLMSAVQPVPLFVIRRAVSVTEREIPLYALDDPPPRYPPRSL